MAMRPPVLNRPHIGMVLEHNFHLGRWRVMEVDFGKNLMCLMEQREWFASDVSGTVPMFLYETLLPNGEIPECWRHSL